MDEPEKILGPPAAMIAASGERRTDTTPSEPVECAVDEFRQQLLASQVEQLTLQNEQLQNSLTLRTLELKAAYQELKQVALEDPLTRVANRTLFTNRLNHWVEIARRRYEQFMVVLINLDNFKEINDAHGHTNGDLVLREMALRLKTTLRRSDTLARLGGDEFALILPQASVDFYAAFKYRLGCVFRAPVALSDGSVQVNASIGFSVYPAHGEDAEQLLSRADVAMHNAKASGQGACLFDLAGDSTRVERIYLVRELGLALARDLLTVVYQPIVGLESRQVEGVETLSRWNHPAKGFIPPDQFISIAEQKGLIGKLTEQVVGKALCQLQTWRNSGLNWYVTVNLSLHSFQDPELPVQLAAHLNRLGLKPANLYLEITESMTMADPDRGLKILHVLKEMGLHISMDDFGTGYSSLSHLNKLAVDEVKIDRCFVMDMDTNNENRLIVKSTIDLAHTLGKQVVAEGVENQAVVELLDQYGCDKLQGYHIAKPQSADDLSRWLHNSPWSPLSAVRSKGVGKV